MALFPNGVFFVVALFGLVLAALWIFTLVEALVFPDERWSQAGQSKLLWVLLIVLLGLLGSLLYVVMPRPALRRATS